MEVHIAGPRGQRVLRDEIRCEWEGEPGVCAQQGSLRHVPGLQLTAEKNPYKQSKILVAGNNFGCGSSREHAPWAISDFGIRCIIASG
eukprot:682998-Hanusia_phi.AAC.2